MPGCICLMNKVPGSDEGQGSNPGGVSGLMKSKSRLCHETKSPFLQRSFFKGGISLLIDE